MPEPLTEVQIVIDADPSAVDQVFSAMEQNAKDGWYRDHEREKACEAMDNVSFKATGTAFFTCDERGDRESVTLMLTSRRLPVGHIYVSHTLRRPPARAGDPIMTVIANFEQSVLIPSNVVPRRL